MTSILSPRRLPLLVAALFAAGTLTSCLQKEEPAQIDYGPEVSAGEIDAALISALEKVDDTKMKVGEFIHRAYSQGLAEEGSRQTVTQDVGQTVIERVEQADQIVYKMVEHEITYQSDGKYTKVSREGDYVAQKIASSAVASDLPRLYTLEAPHKALMSLARTLSDNVTYHRLSVETAIVPPPDKVRQREGCEGILNCLINVTRIKYDLVVNGDGPTERLRRELVFSTDVPFLATQLKRCDTALVPVGEGGAQVLYKSCSEIEDFRFEAAPVAETN